MTDVTKDWAGGEPLRESADPAIPAAETTDLIPDSGDSTPPGATSPGEARSFTERKGTSSAPRSKASRSAAGEAEAYPAGSDEESLLRASLETIRIKAEELRGQARGWADVSRQQALQAIDERPVTAIAAAFGAGLVLGALLSR